MWPAIRNIWPPHSEMMSVEKCAIVIMFIITMTREWANSIAKINHWSGFNANLKMTWWLLYFETLCSCHWWQQSMISMQWEKHSHLDNNLHSKVINNVWKKKYYFHARFSADFWKIHHNDYKQQRTQLQLHLTTYQNMSPSAAVLFEWPCLSDRYRVMWWRSGVMSGSLSVWSLSYDQFLLQQLS